MRLRSRRNGSGGTGPGIRTPLGVYARGAPGHQPSEEGIYPCEACATSVSIPRTGDRRKNEIIPQTAQFPDAAALSLRGLSCRDFRAEVSGMPVFERRWYIAWQLTPYSLAQSLTLRFLPP